MTSPRLLEPKLKMLNVASSANFQISELPEKDKELNIANAPKHQSSLQIKHLKAHKNSHIYTHIYTYTFVYTYLHHHIYTFTYVVLDFVFLVVPRSG